MMGTLMDIYALAGQAKKAESLFQSIHRPNAVHYGLLIKAYGKSDQADLAVNLFMQLLEQNGRDQDGTLLLPNVKVCTTLINAWAESTRPDAAEQALAIWNVMETHPSCVKAGIRSDTFTFNMLLKVFSANTTVLTETGTVGTMNSVSANAEFRCVQSEFILDEMERRYKAGQSNVRSNTFSYTLAIKTCIQTGDYNRAESVIERLEDRLLFPYPESPRATWDWDSVPVMTVYKDILNLYADVGTTEAASRAQSVLMRVADSVHETIHQLHGAWELHDSQATMDAQLQQSIVFLYSSVIHAWTKSMLNLTSGDKDDVVKHSPQLLQETEPEAIDQVWRVYEHLLLWKVLEPNMSMYCNLILCLSKSREQTNLIRADDLLKQMEDRMRQATTDLSATGRHANSILPDRRHFGPVMNGWIGIGDMERASNVLLRRIEAYRQYKVSQAAPSPDNFYLITNAYMRSGELIQATLLLEQLAAWYENGQLPEGPDLYTLVTLHSAWQRPHKHSAEEAALYQSKLEQKITQFQRESSEYGT
jgi:PPR repeat